MMQNKWSEQNCLRLVYTDMDFKNKGVQTLTTKTIVNALQGPQCIELCTKKTTVSTNTQVYSQALKNSV